MIVGLTEQQVLRLLEGPMRLLRNETIDPSAAWRDRLVLELLYGAGFRVSELVNLTYGDVSLDEGVARIVGKGGKSPIIMRSLLFKRNRTSHQMR